MHTGNMPSEDKIKEVKVGQTQEKVRELLGSPSSVSSLDDNQWIYMSSTLKKVAFLTPKIINRDVLTIDFDKNGKVSKIAHLDETNGAKITPDKDETQSGGHNPGFFKKYFGGVGMFSPFATTKEK